jgi:hypothetical protein
MPSTVITIPDEHPPMEELVGSYVDGTLFIEYVYVSENIDKAIADAQEKADETAKSLGCDSAGEITITLGEELEGETLYSTLTISSYEENEGYLYFDRVGLDTIDFTYNDTTGRLSFTESNVEGGLVASYLPNKSGITISGNMRVTILGLKMADYHFKLRASFAK